MKEKPKAKARIKANKEHEHVELTVRWIVAINDLACIGDACDAMNGIGDAKIIKTRPIPCPPT